MPSFPSGIEISKLRSEAQNRWLRPAEVFFILKNYEECSITLEPPNQPPSGSLFLFNKRVLRFFRNDGHAWRRKKDGRAVGEAHERLKVGNVDKLNCYYAHGELNPHFQRRCYWILDQAFEHIVLVHYRDVAEGICMPGRVSDSSTSSPSTFDTLINAHIDGTTDFSRSPVPAEVASCQSSVETANGDVDAYDTPEGHSTSSMPPFSEELRKIEFQLSLDDDYDLIKENIFLYSGKDNSQAENHINFRGEPILDVHGSKADRSGYLGRDDEPNSFMLLHRTGKDQQLRFQPSNSEDIAGKKSSLFWEEILELTTSSSTGVCTQEKASETFSSEEMSSSYRASEDVMFQKIDYRGNKKSVSICQDPERNSQLHLSAARKILLGPDSPIESSTSAKDTGGVEDEIPYEADKSICGGNSMVLKEETTVDWMSNMNLHACNSTYLSSYPEMLFGQSQSVSPIESGSCSTLSQRQLFSIREISPEWAYSSERTKVIITGDFSCNHSEYDWKVIFGDVEVPVEIIQNGVIRCHAPQHVQGWVTLCLTAGNRESCSEVREFEYRLKPKTSDSTSNLQKAFPEKSSEELLLLMRFGQTLLRGCDGNHNQNGGNDLPQAGLIRKVGTTDDQFGQIIELLTVGSNDSFDVVDWLLQELLKDKLKQWLSTKSCESKAIECYLTKEEQNVIHLISGLGYEWALSPVLNAGVGVNFRDLNGWTALHWAARFGRERMVAALLAAGASTVAVTDPTTQDPAGKTPASIAADSGHKGLAGYLSEVRLTSHLSSLTVEECDISKGTAKLLAEKAVESISERSIVVHPDATEDQLSLKDSLAAVRNAAQAAARIQSAFRAHSFRKKCINDQICDEYQLTPKEIHDFSAASKAIRGHRDQKLQSAALCIQKKYRGWRGRKNYLTLRQHVVKIQAHIRGHQVRKKYEEFTWMVGFLEKAILRWRRKGVGLRGFKVESETIEEEADDDILKAFRKQKVDVALDEAFSRVLSVVQSADARQQYRRMLEKYRLAKNSGFLNSQPFNLDQSREYFFYEILEYLPIQNMVFYFPLHY
ncbi:unnamed protein product [Spirodela intermedia]|uniref:CG-1 domain-containing protein n=1 Tax=Spirodela intermedia TaxID=51605 RepID=A0A7I8L3V7_SPIIN|nr:unnamed protein product [Spirodela intermedia]